MTRAEALKLAHTEPTLNGRCVGQLQHVEGVGTCLAIVWHAEGCEHEGAGDGYEDHGPGCDGPYNCVCGAVDKRNLALLSEIETHDPCPTYVGQWFHKTAGFCSCGGNHRSGWLS